MKLIEDLQTSKIEIGCFGSNKGFPSIIGQCSLLPRATMKVLGEKPPGLPETGWQTTGQEWSLFVVCMKTGFFLKHKFTLVPTSYFETCTKFPGAGSGLDII